MPGQPTILVVEHDPLVAEMLTDALSLEGYHLVLWKPWGEHESWVKCLATLAPSLLVLDLGGQSLPYSDLEMLADVWPDKPLVLLTTSPTTYTWLQMMGYTIFIKPFHPRALLNGVKHAIAAPDMKAEHVSHYDA